MFKLLEPLPQIVEHGGAAVEQCTPVFCQLDTPAAAVQETLSDRMLQIGDRTRNRGLAGVEKLRPFSHAAGLCHGHQRLQVVQLDPAFDPVRSRHGASIQI